MLIWKKDTLEALCRHAQAEYPRECCGILLGRHSGGQRIACRVVPAANAVSREQNRVHFRIDPLQIAKAESAAAREQLEIVGFYHSHPDQKAVPSKEDGLYMIAGYSYPIIAVQKGKCVWMSSFEKLRQADPDPQEEILVKEQQNESFGVCIGNAARFCK